ncbi:MAG TPA: ABC transporter ATP-binding protein [Polyangiaceae bacterium]|jgi:ABC-type sulfate/molybdate transport systems ATPase subunit|nr:ABC transporter ATP-binding protein [Polyangiaceae bacterium]
MKPGLVLEKASFRYGELWVLLETDFEVPRGNMVVVTGDNGVGKSTLLYLCAGLVPATSGQVLLDGQVPSVTRPSDMIRHGVRRGFVFQHGGLLANRTALDNVTLPLSYHADVLGLDEGEAQKRARELLNELRVTQTDFHTLPAHLSVGVRQRVALARALVLHPTFVFMDDPDAGLDESTKQLVFQRLERLRDDPEVTTVLTSTDPELIDFLGVDVVRLEHGRLLRESRRAQLA